MEENKANPQNCRELDEIRQEISSMRMEFSRFLENSNRYLMEQMTSDVRSSFSKVLIEHLNLDTKTSLNRNMVEDCKMRNFCEGEFNKLLNETAYLLSKDSIKKETVEKYWGMIEKRKEMTGQPMCGQCFAEVSKLYQKQIDIMQSLQVYEKDDMRDRLDDLPEDVVGSICEPIANKQRLSILKALAGNSRGFSELSQITCLRGGNLLFHLQKLLDSEMIVQHSERGNYNITKKGYLTLEGLYGIHAKLNHS
jgi:predicted transcriptional regulator